MCDARHRVLGVKAQGLLKRDQKKVLCLCRGNKFETFYCRHDWDNKELKAEKRGEQKSC